METSKLLSKIQQLNKESLYRREEHIREFRANNNHFCYWNGQNLYVYDMCLWAIKTQSDEMFYYNMNQNTDFYMRYYDCPGSYHFQLEDYETCETYTSDTVKQFILFVERKDTLTVFIFNKPVFDIYGLYQNSYFDLEFEEPAFEVYTAAALFDSSYKLLKLLKMVRSDKSDSLRLSERSSEHNGQ